MENLAIAGKLGGDAKLASTQRGDQVCNFNVAVDTYENGEKGTRWYRVSFWGKRAESLSPYLLKGVSVTCAGQFSLGEYDGKPQLNLRANDVTLQGSRGDSRGERKQSYEQTETYSNQSNGSNYDDLNDGIPF